MCFRDKCLHSLKKINFLCIFIISGFKNKCNVKQRTYVAHKSMAKLKNANNMSIKKKIF